MEKININHKSIFVTGAAGFIGSNLVKRLFKDVKGATIVGIDNMNDYYDPALKEFRLREIEALDGQNENRWVFVKGDIADKQTIDGIFRDYHPAVVVNLAAQAGVRYSITNPEAYIQSNLIGSTTFWRLAATRMTRVGQVWNIWSMPVRRRSMAPTRRFPIPLTTWWITPSASMLLRRSRTS